MPFSFTKQPRTVQNINDPNWFLNANAQGDFNTISSDQSGYGILSAAEKNSTYIAYFDGIGGTTPELINQTGFFIKYLIDEQGNVTQPTPDSISLLNLNTIFQGNSAIVESQDATQVLANLIGEHSVTDIGTIQPLLITETGSNPQSYITTMSFAQYGSIVLAEGLPNYAFKVQKGNTGFVGVGNVNPINIGSLTGHYIFANNLISNDQWDGDVGGDGGEYTFSSNTGDYNIEVSFQFRMAINFTNSTGATFFSMWIEYSNDGGSNWTKLPITNDSTTNGQIPGPNYGQPVENNILYKWMNYTGTSVYLGIKSVPQQFNTGDKIRFVAQADPINSTNPFIKVYGVADTGIGYSDQTFIAASSNYSGELTTTAPYWDGATYPTDGSPQYLTASLGLSGLINSNMVQITPTASLDMGFSPIIFPANIQPGDNIRFEYDLSKCAKIYEISSLDDGRALFKILPAIPSGSKLDHFVVYRVVNDGNYVILNVKKEVTPATMTGFLKPKYISKTLQDNLPDIIDKLKKDNIIPV